MMTTVETEKSSRVYQDLPGPYAGVGVSHSMMMKPEFIGKGHAKQEQFDALKKAGEMGYSYMICVVNDDNVKQIKVLADTGWYKLTSFTNACNEEKCSLWGRHV